MNTTRIINLFRAYFIEHKKMLLICCLIAFAAAVLDFGLSYEAELSLLAVCFLPLWVVGSFFNSALKRNNSSHFFTLPATTGEKFLNAVLFAVVFAITVQILYIAGAYAGYYGLRPILIPDASNLYERVGGRLFFNGKLELEPYLLYAAALSVFLFGSIYFKKNAFWMTIVSGIGLALGYGLYIWALIRITFEDTTFRVYSISFPYSLDKYIFPIAAILLFLSLTYLRLKETEV
ncbi:MAG: hypothetical protein FWH36_07060 [Lentimicrobiaceae bacterium]|nr:hypothetical protein [Lentimicrobiaceae bacterium]